MSPLFEPLRLREITLSNRIGIPPMCQYSAINGLANDWHFVHYGSRAVGGAALMIFEATAVSPDGRISPGDLGLWDDAQIEPLARIVHFVESRGCRSALQLAHAGRKASVGLGWQAQRSLEAVEGGWKTVAPSRVSYGDAYATPQELELEGIQQVVEAFVASTRRALKAGFSAIEIHAAHGYLLHQFLSPLSNRRADAYGGSFENRTRLLTEVVVAVRAAWPAHLPLLVRLSATDWVEGGWMADETVRLCGQLKDLGVDLIDVSSGGLVPDAKIPVGPGFQTPFAQRIRQETGISTAAVGLITTFSHAEDILRMEQADLVLVGREILRNPYWPMLAATHSNIDNIWPDQYLRAMPSGS